MTRKIPYIKKDTTASTEYRKTRSNDTQWVLGQCKRLVEVAEACEKHNVSEGELLNKPNPRMTRQSTGNRNTPRTMCGGVVDNFKKGQYDLSKPQCEGLEESFRIASDIIEDFEDAVFEEVTSFPKLKSLSPAPDLPDHLFG